MRMVYKIQLGLAKRFFDLSKKSNLFYTVCPKNALRGGDFLMFFSLEHDQEKVLKSNKFSVMVYLKILFINFKKKHRGGGVQYPLPYRGKG